MEYRSLKYATPFAVLTIVLVLFISINQKQELYDAINSITTADRNGRPLSGEAVMARPVADPPGIAPCGEVCSYEAKVREEDNEFFPLLQKEFKCDNLIRRMAFRGHTIKYPPPEYPPPELIADFTMDGAMPITNQWYFNDVNNKTKIFPKEQVDYFLSMIEKGESVNIYPPGECVQNTLRNYSEYIRGQHGVVIGTGIQWLESILIANGADKVTTIEYQPLTMHHPKLDATTPYEYAEQYLNNNKAQFDFGATFSSLEHSGLGRYGDPINPFGDLEAMAEVWCMIKPGGMMALGVPGIDRGHEGGRISWNSDRIYGIRRLQHMTANWDVINMMQCPNLHVFLVLRKPENLY